MNDDGSEERITCGDIYRNTNRTARTLVRAGVGKGDTFVLLMRNCPEFLYGLYAALSIGAVAVSEWDPNVIYVGTGEATSEPAHAHTDAILAIDLKTGTVRWAFQATANDIFLACCRRRGERSPNCPPEYSV